MVVEWFVAPMRCPICGQTAPPDSSTNMATKITRGGELSYIRVGDDTGVPDDMIESGGYLPVNPYTPGEPVSLVEMWECPSCGASENWGEVKLRGGVVESIEAVVLDNALLDRIHFISGQIRWVYDKLTGLPLYVDGELRPDAFAILRAHLP